MSSQSQKSQALLSLWRHLVLTSIAKQTLSHTHTHTHTHTLSLTHTYTHTHTLIHTLSHTHTHTHTHTHVRFCEKWGHPIGVMVFILYKLYVLFAYTYPTPKLSPHRRLCISTFPKKPHSV